MAIDLFGEVGWEITAKDVRTQLDGAGDVDVFLNSPGGDVYEGLAVMNALRAHEGAVTIFIEGMAASIASVIAVGGADRVVARPHAELMIHHAWSGSMGDADEMRKSAENLERISANLADIYADKSGMSADAVLDLMGAETWFSASEALAAGFVDAVEDARRPAARGREPVFAKAMARFRFSGRGAAPAPRVNNAVESPPREQEGEPMSFLEKIADAVGMSPEEVRNELSGFFNESVEVEAKVEIEYPDSVKVAPTDKATVEPSGVFPEGVEPSVESGDGVTAEVDANGIVTVVAGEDVKPGDSVDVVVTVGESSAAITVEIVAAADTDGDDSASTPPAPAPSDSVTLDRETYEDLRAAAQHGWQAKQESEERALVAEVDRWVAEGRISAALRSKAVAAIKRDAEIARDLYGSNPKGTIPRAEIGHGHDAKADAEENAVSMSDLDNLVAGRRGGRNNR